MKGPVQQFMNAKKDLMKYFDCPEEYYIKMQLEDYWLVNEQDEWDVVSFAATHPLKGNKTDVIIVRKNGKPMIFKQKEYTMIVGIQCVKVAIVFSNTKECKK
jgi:hypothetical protein